MFPWMPLPAGGPGGTVSASTLETWDANSAVALRDAAGTAYAGPLGQVPPPASPPWYVESWLSTPSGLAAAWDGASTRPQVLMSASGGLPAVRFTGAAPLVTTIAADLQAAVGCGLGAFVRYDPGASESVAAGAAAGGARLSLGRAGDGKGRYVAGPASAAGVAVPDGSWTWQALGTRAAGDATAAIEQGTVWSTLPYPTGGAPGTIGLGGAAGIGLAGDALAFVLAGQAPARADVDNARSSLVAEYSPLPPPQRLRFLPPARAASPNLLVVNLASGATSLTPTATQDVLAVLPAGGWSGTLRVVGGRRLYVIGGVVDPTPSASVSVGGRTLRGTGPILYFQPSAAAVAPALYLWALRWALSGVDFAHCVQVGSPVASTDPVEVWVGNTWVQRLPGTDAAAGSRSSFLSWVPGTVKRAHLWATLVDFATDQALLLRPSDAASQTPWSGVDVLELFDIGIRYADAFTPVLGGTDVAGSLDPNAFHLQVDSATAAAKGWNPVVLKESGNATGDGYGVWLTPVDPGGSGLPLVDPTSGTFAPSADANQDLTWPQTLAAGMTKPLVAGVLRVGTPPVDLVDESQDFDSLRVTTAAQLDAMIGTSPVVVSDDAFTVAQDSGATTLDVLANDTNPGVLTISAVTAPSHGTVGIAPGGLTLTYQPSTGYFGSDAFTYTATDGRTSATGNVAMTVTQVLVVTAAADSASTFTGSAVVVDVLANDTPSGLDLSIVTAPTHGAAVRTTASPRNKITYTPASGYTGSDSLTYKAFFAGNPTGPSATARLGINVLASGSYPSGLPWMSGLNPTGDSGTAGFAEQLAWGKWRGRDVDVYNIKGMRTGTWAQLVSSITAKSSAYATCYSRSIRIEQVVPLIPALHGSDDLNACGGATPNSVFMSSHRQIAAWLAAQNLRRPFIIRLGHELEDAGNAYSPAQDSDQTNFTHYRTAFQRAADIYHAALGSPPSFYIDWCHLRSGMRVPWSKIYPGDQYVDIVGIDAYCTSSDSPHVTTAAQMNAYLDDYWSPGQPRGPRACADWAIAQGKKTGLGEWGISNLPGDPAGGPHTVYDNDIYINGMFDFFTAYASTVIYESYFNVADSKKDHRIFAGGRSSAYSIDAATAYVNKWTP